MTIQDFRRMAGVLIDTNLLVLYSIGLYDKNRIEQHKRTRTYTPEDFDLLVRFANLFKKVITTPNILTEVSNLLEGTAYQYGPVLSHLPQYIQVIEEIYFPSHSTIQATHHHFFKFGLSDMVSFELAKQRYLVLTDDLDFCSFLQSNNLPALNFNNLRTSFILGS